MKNPKNSVRNEKQYKKPFDEIKTLQKENDKLKENLNRLQKKYEKIIEVYESEDCYTCICGLVTECNCRHLGYLKQNLIDMNKNNSTWGIEDVMSLQKPQIRKQLQNEM